MGFLSRARVGLAEGQRAGLVCFLPRDEWSRASRMTNAMATAAHAATATQSMNRLTGSMKLGWAALPNAGAATLYMPSGKSTLT